MTSVAPATAPTPWQARLPFFYGWVIVAIALLTAYIGSALTWAVGVLALPMSDDLGWSRTSLFGAITVRTYVGVAVSPFIGRLFDTPNGPRIMTLVSGIGLAASVAPISFVREEWQFFLLYGVFGGLAAAAQGGQIVGAIVPKWFIRRRGTAMAWATMGTALSVMTVPPAVAWLVATVDWRPTWGIVAAASFLFAAVPALLLRRQPEDLGLLPDGDATPRAGRPAPPPVQEVSLTLREAARTPQFYLLAFAGAIGSLAIVGVPVSLVAIYSEKGLSPEMAVAGYSLFGLFSVIGRFFWGYFINRYHVRWVLIAVAALGAITMPLFLVLPGPAALLCAALAGLANGGQFGFGPMVWPAYFGRLHLGSITGVTRPLVTLVIGSGAGMMALTFDLTGSYATGLLTVGAAWVLSGVGMLLVGSGTRATAPNAR